MLDPNSIATSILRHGGSIIAGILIKQGYVDASYTEAIIGVVVGLGSIVYAWYTKKQAAKVKADTVAVALELPSATRNDTLNVVLKDNNLPPVDLGKP